MVNGYTVVTLLAEMVYRKTGARPLSQNFLKSLAGLGKIRLKFRLAVFFSAEFRLTYLRLIFRLSRIFKMDSS